jgi:hypothetical protein
MLINCNFIFRYNEKDDSWTLIAQLKERKDDVTAMMVPKNMVGIRQNKLTKHYLPSI